MVGSCVASPRRPSRGAAAVEFALIVPLLALLLFGIISYGAMLSFRQTMSQAAAEGARAAAVAPPHPSTPAVGAVAKASAAVAAALGAGFGCAEGVLSRDGATVGSCLITAPTTCTPSNCPYVVTISYDYAGHPLVPRMPLVPMPRSLTYTASAEGNA